jgi:predicted DNA-binding ribbon-helix-helix protein
MSWLVKRSFTLAGHRTSVALEDEFWKVLEQVATDRGTSLGKLVGDIDRDRSPDRPLASLLRLYAIKIVR